MKNRTGRVAETSRRNLPSRPAAYSAITNDATCVGRLKNSSLCAKRHAASG